MSVETALIKSQPAWAAYREWREARRRRVSADAAIFRTAQADQNPAKQGIDLDLDVGPQFIGLTRIAGGSGQPLEGLFRFGRGLTRGDGGGDRHPVQGLDPAAILDRVIAESGHRPLKVRDPFFQRHCNCSGVRCADATLERVGGGGRTGPADEPRAQPEATQ